MNFLFPLGLLGLIGVPILILIYIIKSKYAEQTVSSTYLWTLSERFLKRKRPISPLAGIISLILQILSVVAISLIIAHPIITIPNAANEYCFVLDASGSMQAEEEGSTRFDRAKDKIAAQIRSSVDGSAYSLVLVSDVNTTVFEQSTDKKQSLALLEELDCGYAETDIGDALGIAQSLFSENPALLTYLYTDTDYAEAKNIEVINVASEETNIALTGIVWSISAGELTVNGQVRSYNQAHTVLVAAYVDRAELATAETEVSVGAGESVAFELKAPVKSFSSLRLSINGEDSLVYDDEYIVYDIQTEDTQNILLVSDTPYFLKTALGAIGYNKITVIEPEDYTSESAGYGLYIFDCCTPTQLPSDGAVWFFDPKGSVPNSGFSVQGAVDLPRGELLEKTSSSSTVAKSMIENVKGDELYITSYVKCNLYRSFTTLFSYKGNPIVFAGNNANGHREVVFAFDLHNSNLPLLVDFIVLIENLMNYSFPDVVQTVNYEAGDEAMVNVIANCSSIRVQTPGGSVSYLSTDVATATFPVSEVGTYTITVTVSDIPRDYYIYSSLPEEERIPAPTGEEILLQGEREDGGFDGTFDPTVVLFICLAILFLADWMVYCYEKYQLR